MNTQPRSFWILGAGEFGSRAAERLRKKFPAAVLTAVDQDQGALDRLSSPGIHKVCAEAASYLDEHLTHEDEPDWVVPAVPIHLAFEWVRRRLINSGAIDILAVPADIEKKLPHPKRGPEGQIYASYADFRCPDHCTEPYDLCTWTGKPRKGLLYRTIGEIQYKDFRSIVIRSHQLAPGVGGYQPEALRKALETVNETASPVLFATACLCHAVVHAFRLS